MQKAHYLVRVAAVTLALLAGYVALALHLYNLQVSRHDDLYGKARRKYTASRTEEGRRGRIFDRSGNLLCGNLACRDILAEPRRFRENRGEIIRILSEELDISPSVLGHRFLAASGKGRAPVEIVVKRGVDIRTAERIAAYKFSGIRGIDTYCRYYPKGTLLANVLGFLDSDGKGVSGVEQLLDDLLQPTSGTAVYERDRRGNPLQRGNYREQEKPKDGLDVYLTIEEPIQQIVEDELSAMVEQFAPKTACALMVNPKTGAVMALAQRPTFDPNDRSTMSDVNCQNRILIQGFEPGSVMKSIAIAGALDYGVVTLNDIYDCEDGYWVYCRRPLRDSGHEYGLLRVWEIIQKSSNIGTAKIALDMGEGRLYQTLSRFGFGEPTGVWSRETWIDDSTSPTAREASGIFRPLPEWDGLSITRFPIGQGILVTPMQLTQAYCALANNGLMMQLHLIGRTLGKEVGDFRIFHPTPRRRSARPEAIRAVIEAMKLVTMEGGTAPKAAVEGYEVAGKTGTAQKYVYENGRGYYSHSKFVASFIGFVPADDPAFVLLIAADEPSRGGHYGGTIAAPSFSRIAEKTLRYLQVAPTQNITLTREDRREMDNDDTDATTSALR